MNTGFRKRLETNDTCRKIKETDGIILEPITKETHEQLDYWLVPNRWKNSVKNMESDTKVNIDADHHPVVGAFKIKLRGISTLGKHRNRFGKCTTEDNANINPSPQDNRPNNIND